MNKKEKSQAKFPTYALLYVEWPGLSNYAGLGHDNRNQRMRCKRYARSKGYVVSKSHYGYSHLHQIVEKIKNIPERKYVVIVDSLQRIHPKEKDRFLEELKSTGTPLVSLGYDLALPATGQTKRLGLSTKNP